jgi:hypothetical protein
MATLWFQERRSECEKFTMYDRLNYLGWFMVFNATFNNFLPLSWRSVLLVEETEVSRENH